VSRPRLIAARTGAVTLQPASHVVVKALAPITRLRSAPKRDQEITDAAAKVFAERGFHGATTQDIADLLGIRQASLYYYFSTKDEALERVCLKGAEGFYETAKLIAEGPGNALAKLEALIRAHHAPLGARLDYVRVFQLERRYLPSASRRKVGRWSRGLERMFEKVIKEGVANGAFAVTVDPRLATLGILGMINGVPHWFEKDGRSLEVIASGLVDLALRGLVGERR
jgi:TetR/AcrR family transcriptional regulator, cholesterol catabolism regulator